MRVSYVEHATALLEFGGCRLLTDPLLRSQLGPLRRVGPGPARLYFAGDAGLFEGMRELAGALPIHWGTIYPIGPRWIKPKPLTDPAAIFPRKARERAADVEVRVLAPGMDLEIEAARA